MVIKKILVITCQNIWTTRKFHVNGKKMTSFAWDEKRELAFLARIMRNTAWSI